MESLHNFLAQTLHLDLSSSQIAALLGGLIIVACGSLLFMIKLVLRKTPQSASYDQKCDNTKPLLDEGIIERDDKVRWQGELYDYLALDAHGLECRFEIGTHVKILKNVGHAVYITRV